MSVRRPKRNLPEWDKALNDAHEEVQDEDGNFAPQPLCLDKPGEWADYGYPLPKARVAEALCEPCLLRELCLRNAKHKPPAWGIVGGKVWIDGRQAALLAHDDPRLIDPDSTAPEADRG
jgi:hypothetical protein